MLITYRSAQAINLAQLAGLWPTGPRGLLSHKSVQADSRIHYHGFASLAHCVLFARAVPLDIVIPEFRPGERINHRQTDWVS